ncbi:DUF2156 domain-containing protein [Fusibacter ferrireducens]|uniref:DUF2156 domain-containing protein n=1 Tax=Fusibacter ferrireducens TaxID=2785058 RepID=A0ABR9ZQX1_9FIRM|nr:phosphatidylglycerol lysyltransferase domain-containing protein [Fusibacter ferrireducens]MBF4692721.1 DUF2156 domain-containing protein [Fusibacter ferrireducens]
MELKKLDYDQLAIVRPYFEVFNSEVSDINLTNLMMWRDKYQFYFIEIESFLFIVNIKGAHRYFSQPIGAYTDPKAVYKAVCVLKELCENEQKPLVIKKANEAFVTLLNSYDMTFELKSSIDEQDYIYDFEALKQLSGKKYHKKKNHINKFIRTYEDWRFKWYEASDLDSVDELLQVWLEVKKGNDMDPNLRFEYNGIMDVLKHRHYFDLKIGLIYVEGNIAGFIIGEVVNTSCLLVHIEKADISYEGIFSMLGYTLYNELDHLTFINREQDLGIEGLRKSKLSYHPVKFIQKFELWF